MAIFGPNIDSLILTALFIALPTVITYGRSIHEAMTNRHTPGIAPNQSRLLQCLAILVFLHSAYILYIIFFDAPSNVFTALNVSLTAPTSILHTKLAARSLDDTLPPQMAALLTRLQSFDVRGYYVRFGHDAIQRCDYCHTFTDFGMFVAPLVGLQYMRTIILVGFMTLPGSGKRYWRGWAVGALAVAGLAEAWTLPSAAITISQQNSVVMWHDRVWYCRQILFLVLPIVLHMLPYQANPYASLQAVPYAVQSVESTLSSLYVLDAVRRASLRDDDLRGRTSEFYQHDALTSRLAQRDEEIRDEAERAGLALSGGEGNDEGAMGLAVRGIVSQWRTRLIALLRSSSSPTGGVVGSAQALESD